MAGRKLLAASIGIAAASFGCSNQRTVGNAMPTLCRNDDCGPLPDTAPPACPWPDPPSGGCAFSQLGIGYEPNLGVCTYDELVLCADGDAAATASKDCRCVDVSDGGREWTCTTRSEAACACASDAGGAADVVDGDAPDAAADAGDEAGPGCDRDAACAAGDFYTCTQCAETCCQREDGACFADPTCRRAAECIAACRTSCVAGSADERGCFDRCVAGNPSPLANAYLCCLRANCAAICPT